MFNFTKTFRWDSKTTGRFSRSETFEIRSVLFRFERRIDRNAEFFSSNRAGREKSKENFSEHRQNRCFDKKIVSNNVDRFSAERRTDFELERFVRRRFGRLSEKHRNSNEIDRSRIFEKQFGRAENFNEEKRKMDQRLDESILCSCLANRMDVEHDESVARRAEWRIVETAEETFARSSETNFFAILPENKSKQISDPNSSTILDVDSNEFWSNRSSSDRRTSDERNSWTRCSRTFCAESNGRSSVIRLANAIEILLGTFRTSRRLFYSTDDHKISLQLRKSSKFAFSIERIDFFQEFLTSTDRLVISPLTERCFITVTTSLYLFRAVSCNGPAGEYPLFLSTENEIPQKQRCYSEFEGKPLNICEWGSIRARRVC